MTINEIKECHISPFGIEDEKIKKAFSFFLHHAPTIDSKSAANIPLKKVQRNWENFINDFNISSYKFYSDSYNFTEDTYEKYKLNNTSEINRRDYRFICKRKYKDETDCECFLRHLRNSIAHSNVYLNNAGNRKYILFEDYNRKQNKTAIIILSKTKLSDLKTKIMS